jgi:hypothetical protein
MKKMLITTIGLGMIAGLAQADFLDKGTRTIRADYVIQQDAGQGSSDMDGVEIGFGAVCYELDDLAVVYAHLENSDFESDRWLISAQEHYRWGFMPEQLLPFLGFGAGYGWLDVDGGTGSSADDLDRSGFMMRGEGGMRFLFCEWFGLNLAARYNFSNENIFPDETGPNPVKDDFEDTSWDFAFGIRIMY